MTTAKSSMTVAVVVQLDKMPELGGHELCCMALVGGVVAILLDTLVGVLVGMVMEELVGVLITLVFGILIGVVEGGPLAVEVA